MNQELYRAIRGVSKYGDHPILVYQPSNSEFCFKFRHKRTNSKSIAYVCLGCDEVWKSNPTATTVNSPLVNLDYSAFKNDPLNYLTHACMKEEYGNIYRYKSLGVDVQQIYRLNFTV